MQRLNIPLNSNSIQTRRPRRVLWILVALLVFFVVVWEVSTIVLTRDTVTNVIPIGTEISLRLQPNRQNNEPIVDLLKNIPLISNRSLSIKDILPFTEGEFALFFLSDGSRALSVRVDKQSLPKDLLDSLGIVWKETQPSVFLLSEGELATTKNPPDKSWEFQMPLSGQIGTVRIFGDEIYLEGDIISRGKDRIDIRLPKLGLSKLPEYLPKVRAAIALPVVEIGSKLLSPTINSFISGLNAPSEQHLNDLFDQGNGYLLLPYVDKEAKFLISVTDISLKLDEFKQLLRTASALANPEIRQLPLLDEGSAQEIVADPNKISLEETNISGLETFRVPMTSSEYLMLSARGSEFILTNHEESLRFWSDPKSFSQTRICPGSAAWIDGPMFLDLIDDWNHSYAPDLLKELWNNFPIFSIDESKHATTIMLCR